MTSMSKKLKVGIDVRIVEPHMRGIGLYVERLVYHLAKLNACELILFGNKASQTILEKSVPQVHHIEVPFSLGDLRWEQEAAGKFCDEYDLDVYHGPAFTGAMTGNASRVITVHDLAFWLYPQFYDLEFVRYMEQNLRKTIQMTDLVIATSENTQSDLQRFVQNDNFFCKVTLLGVDDFFYERPQKITGKYDLRKYIVLVVGIGQSRKNLCGTLKAFALLPPQLRQQNIATHRRRRMESKPKGFTSGKATRSIRKYHHHRGSILF